MKKARSFIKVILVLAVMGCIFYLSSQSGTASRVFSDKVMKALRSYVETATWLAPSIKGAFLGNPVIWTRKLAHFIIYLVLGLVTYLVLPRAWSVSRQIALAMSLCLLYAITDELHQLFVPGRSAHVIDVLIDTLGSSVGLSIGCIIKRCQSVLRKK